MENVNQFSDINDRGTERVIDERRSDLIRANAAALVLTTLFTAAANTHVQNYLQGSDTVQAVIKTVGQPVDWIYENVLNGDTKEDSQLPTGTELYNSDVIGVRYGSPTDVSRLYSPWNPDEISTNA